LKDTHDDQMALHSNVKIKRFYLLTELTPVVLISLRRDVQ